MNPRVGSQALAQDTLALVNQLKSLNEEEQKNYTPPATVVIRAYLETTIKLYNDKTLSQEELIQTLRNTSKALTDSKAQLFNIKEPIFLYEDLSQELLAKCGINKFIYDVEEEKSKNALSAVISESQKFAQIKSRLLAATNCPPIITTLISEYLAIPYRVSAAVDVYRLWEEDLKAGKNKTNYATLKDFCMKNQWLGFLFDTGFKYIKSYDELELLQQMLDEKEPGFALNNPLCTQEDFVHLALWLSKHAFPNIPNRQHQIVGTEPLLPPVALFNYKKKHCIQPLLDLFNGGLFEFVGHTTKELIYGYLLEKKDGNVFYSLDSYHELVDFVENAAISGFLPYHQGLSEQDLIEVAIGLGIEKDFPRPIFEEEKREIQIRYLLQGPKADQSFPGNFIEQPAPKDKFDWDELNAALKATDPLRDPREGDRFSVKKLTLKDIQAWGQALGDQNATLHHSKLLVLIFKLAYSVSTDSSNRYTQFFPPSKADIDFFLSEVKKHANLSMTQIWHLSAKISKQNSLARTSSRDHENPTQHLTHDRAEGLDKLPSLEEYGTLLQRGVDHFGLPQNYRADENFYYEKMLGYYAADSHANRARLTPLQLPVKRRRNDAYTQLILGANPLFKDNREARTSTASLLAFSLKNPDFRPTHRHHVFHFVKNYDDYCWLHAKISDPNPRLTEAEFAACVLAMQRIDRPEFSDLSIPEDFIFQKTQDLAALNAIHEERRETLAKVAKEHAEELAQGIISETEWYQQKLRFRFFKYVGDVAARTRLQGMAYAECLEWLYRLEETLKIKYPAVDSLWNLAAMQVREQALKIMNAPEITPDVFDELKPHLEAAVNFLRTPSEINYETLMRSAAEASDSSGFWLKLSGALLMLAGVALILASAAIAVLTGGLTVLAGAAAGLAVTGCGATLFHYGRQGPWANALENLAEVSRQALPGPS